MVEKKKTASASVVKAKPNTANKTTLDIKVKTGAKVKSEPKVKSESRAKASVVPKPEVKKVNVGKVGAGKKLESTAKADKTVAEQSKVGSKADEKSGEKKKSKLIKKQFRIICLVAAVLIAILVAVLILVLSRKPVEMESDDEGVAETTQEVDYDQKVTSEDGGVFKAEYQAGSEKSFAVRFADLKCEDGCKNVSGVKVGKKVLKRDEDYEVKKGSIIIILTEDYMKGLKAGKHDLVVSVVDEDETMLYGVKFTVKAEPTCGEGEKLEKGECVKEEKEKEEEEKKQEQNDQATDQPTQSVQPDTPSKSQAEIDCEKKEGPTGFLAVHWVSENETTDAAMSGTIKMHRVNGVCRPNVAQAQDLTGRGFGTTGQPISESTHPSILENRGQDIIIWTWSDGSLTVDKVSSAFNVWSY